MKDKEIEVRFSYINQVYNRDMHRNSSITLCTLHIYLLVISDSLSQLTFQGNRIRLYVIACFQYLSESNQFYLRNLFIFETPKISLSQFHFSLV